MEIKKSDSTFRLLKENLNKNGLSNLLKVEDQNKQHLNSRRVRERRAARIETLPNGEKRSNERRGPDRRTQSANLKKYWAAVMVWMAMAMVMSATMAFSRFNETYLGLTIGFYSLSLIFFIYLSFLFNAHRNRRKSDKDGYFFVVLGVLSLFSFIMCQVGIFLY